MHEVLRMAIVGDFERAKGRAGVAVRERRREASRARVTTGEVIACCVPRAYTAARGCVGAHSPRFAIAFIIAT